jgi:hypothetical protein
LPTTKWTAEVAIFRTLWARFEEAASFWSPPYSGYEFS